MGACPEGCFRIAAIFCVRSFAALERAEAVRAGAQSPEAHACEEPSSSSCRAQTEEASAGAATIHGAMTEGEEAAILDSELLQEDDEDSASQAAERLESIGDAACCLNDTFEVRTQALNTCLAPSPSTAMDSRQPSC